MSPSRKGWGSRTIVFLIVLLASSPARLLAGLNDWSAIDMESGGHASGVAWHPTRDGHLFAAVGSRIYRSVDRAQTWTDASRERQMPHGGFAFDPANAQRIYASGDPVLRSDDGGATFLQATRLPVGAAQSIAVSRRDSALFAAHADKVYRSMNGAQSWADVSTGLPAASGPVPVLFADQSDAGIVYLLQGATRLYRTADNGASWMLLENFATPVQQIVINPFDPAEMLACSGGNTGSIRRSIDGGITWTHLASLACSWLGYDPTQAGRLFALQGRGVTVSTDGGVTWNAGSRLQSSQGTSVGAVSPTTSGLLAFGTVEGVLASEDSGATIHLKSRGIRAGALRSLDVLGTAPHTMLASFFGGPEGIHQRTGLGWRQWDVTALRSAFDGPAVISDVAMAADGLATYAASFGGVAKTLDGGANWLPSSSVFLNQYVTALATDPVDPQIVYAATSTSGILRSANGGATWSARNSGLPDTSTGVYADDVVVNPHRPSHLYAKLSGDQRLFVSHDSGLAWREVSGLPSPPPRVPAFDRRDPDTLYVIAGFELHRSTDSGASWAPIPMPQPLNAINSVYFDSSATGSLSIVLDSSSSGLQRTVDGGAHWERLPWRASVEPMSDVFADPWTQGNLLAATHSHGMYEFQIAPDIQVALSGVSSPLSRQSVRTLRVEVRNAGPYAARDVTLTFSIPAMGIPGQVHWPRGTCSSDAGGRQWTCHLGALLNGESIAVTVPLAFAEGEGAFAASAWAHEPELESRDNSVTQELTVLPASDISVALAGVPAQMRVGDKATLVARVLNAGPDAGGAVTLSTAIPVGLDAAISKVSRGTCSFAGRMIICELGTLAPAEEAVVEIVLTTLTVGTVPLSVAALHVAVETNVANNTATLSIAVNRAAGDAGPGTGGGGSSAGGGGGGGATDWAFVLALLGIWSLRSKATFRLRLRQADCRTAQSSNVVPVGPLPASW